MLSSDILDAAIGLFLVYFLFAVLCSALNEWILGHLRGLRAKVLEIGVERLLACADTKDRFFDLPLIKALTEKDSTRPSYISSATFVDGLVTLVRTKAKEADPAIAPVVLDQAGRDLDSLRLLLDRLTDTKVTPILQSLLSGAKNMEEARKRLEAWFDEGMDRATGWYKKRAQVCTAVLALLLVVALNADTITITRELLKNSRLRAALVAAAEETVKQSPATNAPAAGSNTVAAIEMKIRELDLPLGWSWYTHVIDSTTTPPKMETTLLRREEDWLVKAVGFLATTSAISLGAPFWFDLLSKLINVRAAGRKPETSKEERKT